MPNRHAAARAATSRRSVLMARSFDRLRHPLTLGAGLEQHAHPRPAAKYLRQALARRRDRPVEDHRPVGVHDPNQRFTRMQINGTILHGWLLRFCALSAVYHD